MVYFYPALIVSIASNRGHFLASNRLLLGNELVVVIIE